MPSGRETQLQEIRPNNNLSLVQIFVSFLRLGATAFGGVSMVAYLRKTVVDQKGWLDYEEFSSGLALCQMIPGATTMQLAGYIGLRLHGLIGALVSFTAFGLPALCTAMNVFNHCVCNKRI